MHYQLQTAGAIGRSHLVSRRNGQDAYAAFTAEDFAAGIICDGCSEGVHSEVGAALASQFLINKIQQYHTFYRLSPFMMAEKLSKALDGYLVRLIQPYKFLNLPEITHFVQHHLLFTVVGFIWTPETTAVFYAGDGTHVVNGEDFHDTQYLNVGDTPLYPAYKMIPFAIPSGTLVPDFEVRTYPNVTRLMIGSDAWKDERDLLGQVFEQKRLQRWINRLSEREHRFSDDVSVIALEAEAQS